MFDYIEVFGVRGEVIWEEVSAIEAATAWNEGISCKILKITHTYLIF